MTASDRVPRALRTLFAIQLVAMGAMEMSGPFWPLHLRALASSDALFALAAVLVYVGPMVGAMLTGSFWGRVGDRFGHKPMMIRALLALALTQFALAWAADVWTVLALRLLQGACAGFIAPAQAYGVSVEAAARRARLFAFLQVATNVGSLAGGLAGGLILDHASFFWINVAAALLCALCAAAVARALPAAGNAAPVARPASTAAAVAESAAAVPIAALLVVSGLLLASRMIAQVPLSLYVPATFAVDHWVTGLCHGLMGLGFVVAAPHWARHFEGRPALVVLKRIAVVAAACAAFTALAAATRQVGVFVAAYFVWGALLGATTPLLTSLVSAAAGPQRQGRALGQAHATHQFASIAGISLGMALTQRIGLEHTYVFVCAAYLLAMLVIVATWRSYAGAARGRLPAPQGSSSGL